MITATTHNQICNLRSQLEKPHKGRLASEIDMILGRGRGNPCTTRDGTLMQHENKGRWGDERAMEKTRQWKEESNSDAICLKLVLSCPELPNLPTARHGWSALKFCVRTPALLTDQCEYPFVQPFGAGWIVDSDQSSSGAIFLAVGSFLLTVEFFCLQLCSGAFLLTD